MAKRLLLLLALGAVLAGPAFAGLGDDKAEIDQKLAHLRSAIARHQAQESRLSSQIAGLTTQIHGLERRVGDVSSQLSALQADLALHQRRLDKLNQLWRLQTTRFNALKRTYALSVRRLNLRLVNMYKQDEPTAIDVVLQSRSFDDVLDQLDYLSVVAKQDKKIALEVAVAKQQVKVARAKTRKVREGVQRETHVISAREQQQRNLRDQLLASKSQLAGAKADKSRRLVVTKKQIEDETAESRALEQASAELAARLRASEAQSAGDDNPPPAASGGLAWPIVAPITSPFGYRWGRLHQGIDLGAPYGAAIHAAATGTVVWCGWMSGYGNLVMIDHHNGLATVYGHQSRIAVGCNQTVFQGQTVGYIGSTGHSTGPHLHFEVRLHGAPVDPLGYLP
jgi:murein DD-endopeptidase MepM/ murein hydrolase activator NlpD